MEFIKASRQHLFTGHKGRVFALTTSDHGEYFFTSGEDGQIVQWLVYGKGEGIGIAKVEGSVYDMLFLPGSDQLLVAENYNGLHLLNLESNTRAKSLALPGQQIFSVVANGHYFYLGTSEGELLVVSQADFTIYRRIKLATGNVRAIAVNPTTEELAVGTSDAKIHILDLEDLSTKSVLTSHRRAVFSLAYSPDGSRLLSGSMDAHLKAYSTADPYHKEIFSVVAHNYTINALAYSPNGEFLATASKDKSIKIWNAEDLRLLKVIDRKRHEMHLSSVNKVGWLGNYALAGVSDDRSASVWELEFPE